MITYNPGLTAPRTLLASVGVVLAVLVFYIQSGHKDHEISLNGRWTVTNANKSISVTGDIPGGIYMILHRNNVTQHPYHGFNDEKYAWVAMDNWTFSRTFDAPSDVLKFKRINLVAHGLDTVCDVRVNGALLISSTNMFVRYVADAKNVLKEKENKITVQCESAVNYALRQHKLQASFYPVYPLCPPSHHKGFCHGNHIRRVPERIRLGAGTGISVAGYLCWKTGPTSGLSASPSTRRRPRTRRETGRSSFHLDGHVLGDYNDIHFETTANTERNLSFDLTCSPGMSHDALTGVQASLNVKRWWPNGYGEPNLYTLRATISANGESCTKSARFGFRTVRLVEDLLGRKKNGAEFYIEVNGVPIFAKGSTWIPADSFPEMVTPERLHSLLHSAKMVHMNMLRVWGGGYYESDEFYDLADEMGIMVWQEMMFATSLYPAHNKFLADVSVEVQQQVRRLQRHPSIVLWAGNYEIEQGIASKWWPEMLLRDMRHRLDYHLLFIGTIQKIVEHEDGSRPYILSSPTNGNASFNEEAIAANPNTRRYGDVHHFNYHDDGWVFQNYPMARFVSAYGFTSYPSRELMEKYVDSNDTKDAISPESQFLKHRDHRTGEASRNFHKHFRFQMESGEKGYDMVSYLTQLQQAESIRIATEYFRRNRAHLDNKNYGHTMGAMYWHLNDMWPGPKLVFHWYLTATLKVWVVNDLATAISVQSSSPLSSTHGRSSKLVKEDTFEINDVPNGTAIQVFENKLKPMIDENMCDDERCFLWCSLRDSNGNLLAPESFVWPSTPYLSKHKKGAVTIVSVSGSGRLSFAQSRKTFKVHLRAKKIALYVWLEAPGIQGYFQKNGFIMRHRNLVVEFKTTADVDAAKLKEIMKATSLTDYTKLSR
ncbi:hypothetical protein MRX96_029397 [Rhipicephalus microplus]